MKVSHQQGAQLKDQNRGIAFTSEEINNYHHIGSGYLEFDIMSEKNSGDLNNVDSVGKVDEPFRLVKIPSSYAFNIARLLTTGCEEVAQNKNVGHLPSFMRH